MNLQYRNLNQTALKMRLYQIGDITHVYDRVSVGSDSLGNDVKEFHRIGESIVMGHWGGATDEERDIESGEFNKVTPTFIFPHDSIIKDDAHIFYDGNEYEITATTNRGNHIVSDGKQVQILSTDHEFIVAKDEDGNELPLPLES